MTKDEISTTLYVTDLDGTLLGDNSELSVESVNLLNQAISLGANITVATARTPATVSLLLKGVEMKLPAIVMTGAALWDMSTQKYENVEFLPPPIVEKLREIYCKESLPVFIYTLQNEKIEILHIGPLSESEKSFINERAKSPFKHFNAPCDNEMVEDLKNVMLFYAMQPTDDVERTYNRIKNIKEVISVYYHDIFGPETGILEVFSNKVSKASAIQHLVRRHNFSRVVVFGDNINDLPMMRSATHSVAVGNAIEDVRNAADEVIGKNSDDAVAKWIFEDTKRMVFQK